MAQIPQMPAVKGAKVSPVLPMSTKGRMKKKAPPPQIKVKAKLPLHKRIANQMLAGC